MARTDDAARGPAGWLLIGLGTGVLLAIAIGASAVWAAPVGLVALAGGSFLLRRSGSAAAPTDHDTDLTGHGTEPSPATVSDHPDPQPHPAPTDHGTEPSPVTVSDHPGPQPHPAPTGHDTKPSPATVSDHPGPQPDPTPADHGTEPSPATVSDHLDPQPESDPEPQVDVEVAAVPAPLWATLASVEDAALEDVGIAASAVALEFTGGSSPPYVRRDVDARLDEALQREALERTGGIVVARGPAASGVSRCLWEALRRHAGHRPVLVVRPPALADPDASDPLPALVEAIPHLDLDLDGMTAPVVWIDDAHRHLGHGLALSALDRLVTALPGCIVALTVDSTRLALPELVPDSTERWMRRLSDSHELTQHLSAEEMARADEVLPAASLDRRRERLAAWAGGHDRRGERIDRLSATDPLDAAVIAVVGAWQRTRSSTAIPRPALHTLVRLVASAAGTGAIDAAIGRLTTSSSGPALVQEVAPDRFRMHASLLTHTAASDDEVSREVWDTVLDPAHHVGGALMSDVIDIGRAALAADRPDAAQRAWSLAARAADPDVAGRGALHLGLLHEQRGDARSAELAYRPAAGSASAHADLAAFHLGGVLEQLGRTDDAEAAYRQAVGSGHADAAPLAAFNLGWLHESLARHDAAIAAYEQAVTSEHPDAAPMAAFNLGWLLERQRRNQKAEVFYRQALGSGHPDVAPMAAVSLGVLLERLRRPGEARLLFQRAATSGHAEAAAAAKTRLGPTRRR